jgi:manganese transport protein
MTASTVDVARSAVVAADDARLDTAAIGSRRTSLRRLAALFGPAFIAGIAYVDPGNVATNFTAGSRFGYTLVWVIVLANLAAALIQSLAAKLGLATGQSLAEVTRARFRRPVVVALWLQAELVAVATDLAEVVGGAVALQLLFGLPLFAGSIITALAAVVLLRLRDHGYRLFEVAVTGLFAVIALGFCYLTMRSGASSASVASGLLPKLGGNGALVIVSAMIGATIMPHALYVHSALTAADVHRGERGACRHRLRAQRLDTTVAMTIAGMVNLSMLVTGAAVLHGTSGDIPGVHAQLGTALGGAAAFAFAVALLASGLASSGVGTYAGEVIMAGYLRRRVPRWVRRALTLVPVVAMLAVGIPATTALIASQVVLSLGIPVALACLLLATADRKLMGDLVNRRGTTIVASAVAAVVVVLNGFVLVSI